MDSIKRIEYLSQYWTYYGLEEDDIKEYIDILHYFCYITRNIMSIQDQEDKLIFQKKLNKDYMKKKSKKIKKDDMKNKPKKN